MNCTAIIITLIIVIGVLFLISGITAVCIVIGAAKWEKESLKRREVPSAEDTELRERRPYPERIQKVRDEMERDKK